MAKELLIMRHAKSSWGDSSMADHDRPLNKRGLRDAPRMAGILVEEQLEPDLIISSSANRALSTARLVAENLSRPEVELDVVADFYHASPQNYIEVLQRLSDQFSRPMVVGHNPGLEDLVSSFSDTWQTMPTAAIAVLSLPVDSWSQFEAGSGQAVLVQIYRPREI